MTSILLPAGLVLFGVGFVTLFSAAVMKPENARRLPIRLTGMFSTGASFLVMSLGFLLPDLFAHQLTLGTVLFTGLAIYFGVDTIGKGLAEKRAAGK